MVIALVAALALAGGVLALGLEPRAGTDTLVSPSSEVAKATEDFKQRLRRRGGGGAREGRPSADGAHPRSRPPDQARGLPVRQRAARRGCGNCRRACAELAKLKPAKVVFGPGTFINTAAGQITDEFTRRRAGSEQQADDAAEAARKLSAKRGDPPARQRELADAARELVTGQFTQQVLQLALRYGITGLPSIDSPDFVSTLVFDTREGAQQGRTGVPKSRFAYLFPSPNAALIQVRLKPELSEADRGQGDRPDQGGRPPTSRSSPSAAAQYVVSGVPVVVEGLADEVRSAIFVLLGAALLLMAATLALVFRSRLPLLPLALALAAAAMTYGALALVGGGLTMASIAVLPVLIGLAVDYAIQFQARHDEERDPDDPDERDAAARAAAAGGPTIATAGLATAVGFLVLLLSPVPMVRGFGALVVAGIVLALACALTAGFAALVRFGGDRARLRRAADVPARARAGAGRRATRVAGSRAGRGLVAALAEDPHPRRRARRAQPRLRGRAAAAGARRRAGGGDRRLGGRHPERGRVRRARARAARPPGARGREHPPGGDRRVWRDRRDRARRRHHPARGDRLDDEVPAGHAQGQRLFGGRHLPPEEGSAEAVPGALAARHLPLGQRQGPAPDQRAPRRGAGLLLAGRGHQGPQDREPRVRHQAPVAGGAEEGGGPDQGAARPAQGRDRLGRGPARAGGRRQRGAVLALAPRAHAGRRAGSPCSWCCWRSAAAAARPPCR